MKKKLPKIPPQYSGFRTNAGITDKLRRLDVGDKIILPVSAQTTVHGVAYMLGIKVATRKLGSKTTVTVWRVE